MVDAAELRTVALFGSLDDEELAALGERAQLVEVPSAGVDLTREGDFGHAVFAVLEGTADVTVDGSRMRELRQGEFFGEIAVLISGRRTATVTSTSPMRLVSIFKRDLWRIAEGNAAFGEALRHATSPATDAGAAA